ncbi:family 65 glycosyl hydrolase [Paenibacillus sp. VTT E-133280]|jgi:maltose phosphorylase|uniref:glycoside hydrolase family 65 protein n=1 Tax=Paenibacillus sp. VTT E-133280 TaxID=1986222 RepID=UPI000BA18200|nr:glycosyl hydrolase family 65 protein [Paenibacillus sp. VTT E-133280]OZQ61548.1 family 65 glycosyl hydrolase [Paenibacillus sp. VTT E-133280]
MAKVADKYLKVDPWAIIEEGFDPERNRTSESIFSLGNEYMGVRGYAEEGYSGDSLQGSYFNGLNEQLDIGNHYKGIIRSLRYMVNAVDWLYTRITVNGEQLDLAKSKISEYVRKLDLRSGTYRRELLWHLDDGKILKVVFTRLVSMTMSHLGLQRVEFEPLNFSGSVDICAGLDFSIIHEERGECMWSSLRSGEQGSATAIMARTVNTANKLFSSFSLQSSQPLQLTRVEHDKFIGQSFTMDLAQGEAAHFTKLVINCSDSESAHTAEELWSKGLALAESASQLSDTQIFADQTAYWNGIWETSDIRIEGDPENQQGIRFCIFQLYQTYHGDHPGFNIGAKGLTGEVYRGLAFWDTESYCLPFYMFNNPKAARSLLDFRYKTLPQAMQRAKDVDCEGACYPIATIDGTESCDLWQHSNLQLHVGTAISYGIWHYVKNTGDKEFLHSKGAEMLIQISRFYATRGQWGQQSGKYGYFGVMGPDEFQLMVNNNCYINLMAQKSFEYTLDTLSEMKEQAPEAFALVAEKTGLRNEELTDWENKADNMKIPVDEVTGVFEEHDGFFDMPHIDIHSIPVTEFPLYSNWSYDRLYRYDMIKQPDVLMFMFLYNGQFTKEEKLANYEYYESRCIHESSLSPSIHSILASEIGKPEEAYSFFEFATRLDLDNYNRNTREGLHTTSIAAAWMNIVYGFGGMRSDGDRLSFQPSLPERWSEYSFQVMYEGVLLRILVNKTSVTLTAINGGSTDIIVYGQSITVDASGTTLPLGEGMLAR